MSQDVDLILQRNSIETYIRRFVSLKKRGRNYIGLCPFHNESTPSFTISSEKQIFKCFGCGKGGNVITFVQEYEGLSFFESLQFLAELSGVKLSYKAHNNQKNKEELSIKEKLYTLNDWIKKIFIKVFQEEDNAKTYFQQRKISSKLISYFEIGYSPNRFRFLEHKLKEKYTMVFEEYQKHCITLGVLGTSQHGLFNRFEKRVTFPLHDINGKCIGFSGRVIEEVENRGKYVNSPESIVFHKKYHLYHLDKAKDFIRKEKRSILVEGFLDVLGFVEKDIFSVVGTMGTAFSIEQAKLLKRYADTVYLFFDQDAAGIDATYKSLFVCRRTTLEIKVIFFEDHQVTLDPFDYCRDNTKEELMLLIDNAKTDLDFLLWYCTKYKSNTMTPDGKRKCIEYFFTYVQEISAEWEKEHFIEQLSVNMFGKISESLWFDFKSFKKIIPANTIVFSKKLDLDNKMSRNELEVLSIIIRFPNLLHHSVFDQRVVWNHAHAEVLFLFLYKKIIDKKETEINIHKLGEFLTPELFASLTQVIVMDNIFLEKEEYLKKNEIIPQDYYLDRLEVLLKHQQIDYLQVEVKRLQSTLATSGPTEYNSIINQITEDLKKINHLKYKKKS